MAHQGEYIKKILKERKITQATLAEDIGVSRGQLIKILSRPLLIDDSIGTLGKIQNYLGINVNDIPEPTKNEIDNFFIEGHHEQMIFQIGLKEFFERKQGRKNKLSVVGNAKEIGPARTDGDGDTKLTQITPGYWGMMVELVPEYAKAGYLTAYANQEYIDELPKHYFTVDKFVRGKYRAFEISGDSMDNGSIEEAIPNGAIVLARELKRDAWRSKLHNHTWPNWIFVHRYEGIICKQIAHQDVQNGVLTLRSLNPDKDRYPDIELKMDELEQIYNVILRQLK